MVVIIAIGAMLDRDSAEEEEENDDSSNDNEAAELVGMGKNPSNDY